jgi:hypothetical protein
VALGLLAAAALVWTTAADDLAETLPFLDPAPDAELIQPEGIQIYDPRGTGNERDEDLANLLDGDEETSWRTEHYQSPAFGGLKEGVGFVLDLGSPVFVERVTLRSVLQGVDVQLRAAEAIESDPGDWRVLDDASDASDVVALEPDRTVRARFLLVWIHGKLPPSPYSTGRFTAEFSQVAVEARPADAGD